MTVATPSVSAQIHDQPTIPPGSGLSSASNTSAPFKSGSDSGKYLGDYELLEELGRGGMGVVFKARQLSLNRLVAVKMILAGRLASPQDVKRFRAEAEAAAALDHPGIIPVYEVNEQAGQHYYSMAYVEGESLSNWVTQGPLPPDVAAECLLRLTEAVEYAHQRGIIHRDLKPGNVLIDPTGQPRITDFGLAKRVDQTARTSSTGDVCGTISYMPPEQAEGQSQPITSATDVYSLGATMYCLLTGRPPFHSASVIDTLLQVVQQDPVPIRQLNSSVHIDLETICLKCLEKEPSRRYPTAAALGADLQRFLIDEPILARPPNRWEQLLRWSRRHPGLALSMGMTATALVALLLVSVLFNFLVQGEKLAAQANLQEVRRLQWNTQQLLEQVSQLRHSDRALSALRFAEFGRLSSLAHQFARTLDVSSTDAARIELQTSLDEHAETWDRRLEQTVGVVQSLLKSGVEPQDPQWRRAATSLTLKLRQVWLDDTEAIPLVRDQVRQVVVGRFLTLASELATEGEEENRERIQHELRALYCGDLAIIGNSDVIAHAEKFLQLLKPGTKPATRSELRAAARELRAACLGDATALPDALSRGLR